MRVPAPERLIEIPNAELGKLVAGTFPAGFVFHMARCGSSLVSQLLKECTDLIVYSEPMPVNEILAPPQLQNRVRMVAAIRSLAGLFAQHAARPFVIKLSSWNTLYCELLTEAFPDVPWVLCVRDPLEVAVSLLGLPPGWLQQGAAPTEVFARVVDPERRARTTEAYIAQVLAALCAAAARLDPVRGKLIRYEQLPAAVWELVAAHFGLRIDPATLARMAGAATIYAKSSLTDRVAFAPDSARKRAEASVELREAIDHTARPEFERLTRLML